MRQENTDYVQSQPRESSLHGNQALLNSEMNRSVSLDKTNVDSIPISNNSQLEISQVAESVSGPETVDLQNSNRKEAQIPVDEVSLEGSGTFQPSADVEAYLSEKGDAGGNVEVRLGRIAAGSVRVRRLQSGLYETRSPQKSQSIPLLHPVIASLYQVGIEPVLSIQISNSKVTGYVTTREGNAIKEPAEILTVISKHADQIGLNGLSHLVFPDVTNQLENGQLTLLLNDFEFQLGGFVSGTGTFGFQNENIVFSANADVKIDGLDPAHLRLVRDAKGKLSGQASLSVNIANFSGNALAQFAGGTLNVKGTASYNTDKFSGQITIVVTDTKQANYLTRQQLNPEAVQSEGNLEVDEGSKAVVAGPRVIVGWGELDFRFSDWLTGQAKVVMGPQGHITVVGEITPPMEVELFPQRDFIHKWPRVRVRTLYGVPLVGNVFLFANVGLDTLAKLGPGKLSNIQISGGYSTDESIARHLSIQATLNVSAFAGLRLRAEGGLGTELIGHDIKIGVGVDGLAGVRGYIETIPTIGYREEITPQSGRVGEIFLKGHLELAAQPFIQLGGDLFVELDSPFWSPAPDKTWTWPLGQLEYPLPGEFGIAADIDTALPFKNVPEIQFREVDFDAEKFMTDLMNDHVPEKGQGEKKQKDKQKEKQTEEQNEVDQKSESPTESVKKDIQKSGGNFPTGKTKNDPIEMMWFKPPEEKGFYPNPIDLKDEEKGIQKYDMWTPNQKLRVSGSETIKIGLSRSGRNYPEINKTVWKKVKSSKKRAIAKEFKDNLEACEYVWAGENADHVRDLQFDGRDSFDNLWPLDAYKNQQIGSTKLRSQRVYYHNKEKGDTESALSTVPNGRWFKIVAFVKKAEYKKMLSKRKKLKTKK